VRLKYESDPVAGEPFHVTAIEFTGRVQILVRIEGSVIAKKECPDPPCHEICKIRESDAEKVVEVWAKDSDGNEESLRLPVKPARRRKGRED